MSTDMEVRDLKAKDMKTLVDMLCKLDQVSLSKVEKILFPKDGQKNSPMEAAAALLPIVSKVSDDAWAWLGDLVGKSVEEFNEMPFNTPKDVITQLIKKPDFKDFFGDALKKAEEQTESGEGTDTTISSSAGTDGPTES